MPDSLRAMLGRAARSYVVFVAIGLVIGLTLAPVAFQATTTDGTVAVVPLAGTIDGGTSADVTSMLQRARNDPDIDAVVIVANSGGGGAAASEELYLQTKRTAEEMPVVASVDTAALSGAYYTIAPSDRIFVKPASLVGSVGVLANAPTDVEPNSIVATTGPNKLAGADDREFYYILESLGNAFYNAVEAGRGSRLQLSRTELAQARLYSGTQAVQNGMADEVGGRQAAIAHAAEQADLDNYDVKVMRPSGSVQFLSRGNYLGADVPNKTMVGPDYVTGEESAGPTFLMLPASYVVESEGDDRTVVGESAAARDGPRTNASTPVASRDPVAGPEVVA
ncbi:MAG: S49 family peptidase [Haloferacaceae archaeon]